MSDSDLKKCSSCKQEYPKTMFYKKKKNNDGLDCQCKFCVSAYGKKRYQENSEKIRKHRKEYYKEHREESLEYARKFRDAHREELRQYAQNRRNADPERVRAINRASYARNSEKWKALACKKREENPEYAIRYRIQNREELRRKGREYSKNNRDIINANTRKHRKLKTEAEGFYTNEDIKNIYEQQQGLCFYCKVSVEWGKHHKEHKTPVVRGGTNWPDNMSVSCATCNHSKNNKTAEEFFEYLEKVKGLT